MRTCLGINYLHLIYFLLSAVAVDLLPAGRQDWGGSRKLKSRKGPLVALVLALAGHSVVRGQERSAWGKAGLWWSGCSRACVLRWFFQEVVRLAVGGASGSGWGLWGGAEGLSVRPGSLCGIRAGFEDRGAPLGCGAITTRGSVAKVLDTTGSGSEAAFWVETTICSG